MTGVTGNTAEVSTQLAAVLNSLIKPSTEATKAANEMGIGFNAASIQAAGGLENFLLGLDASIQEYAAKTGQLSQTIYGQLFGSAEAMRLLGSLTGEQKEKFSQNIGAMADSAGEMDIAFDNMASTGESLKQTLANQMHAMMDWAGAIASTSAPYVEWIANSGTALMSMVQLSTGIKTVVTWLKAVKVATLAQAAAAKVVAVASNLWKVAQIALNFVLSANPIGIVVMAIAALVGALIAAYNNCETFRNICDAVWAVVKDVASAVWDFLVKAFEKASAVIKKAWEWVKKFFGIKDETTARQTADLEKNTKATQANTKAKTANAQAELKKNKKQNAPVTDSDKNKDKDKDKYSGKKLIANATSYKELGNNIQYYQNKLETANGTDTKTIALYAKKIAALQKQQDAITQLQEAASRPTELKTLKDIDAEITYQQSLRENASAEELAGIDAEIQRLNDLKTAFERNAHVDVGIDKIQTYRQLEKELQYYTDLLKTATETERVEIQKQINALNDLKKKWDETLDDLKKPEDISRLNTIRSLDDAISYYQTKQKNASASEIDDIQRTVLELEKKRDAMKQLTRIPEMEEEVAKLDSMEGKTLTLELKTIGLDGVKKRIKELQDMLADTKSPMDESQRASIQKLIGSYEDYEKRIRKSNVTLGKSWSTVKGVGSGITSLTDALQGNRDAWSTITGVVDAAIQIYEGINGIISIIQTLTAVTGTSNTVVAASGAVATTASAAKTAAAPGEVAASTATMVAVKAEAMAYRELAASEFMAAHAYIPFAGAGIAAGFIAMMQGLVASVAVTPFANGGIVYGPTLALMGEYAGVNSNPEVIAPLNKLKSLIGNNGGGGGGVYELKVKGRDLVAVLACQRDKDKQKGNEHKNIRSMYLHGHFYNQKDERIEVHILTKGDRTKEVVIGEKGGELSFTGDPVELSSEVNDTFDHLLCQQAKVRLLTRNFVPDFFCASCLDAVVNIYRAGKCLFAGYIEPQSYSQGYNEEYDEIELSCIDALIALQYSKYRDVGALGVLYNVVKVEAEQRTFLAMLKEIMGGVTAGLDIVGGNAVRYLYDGSKAVDDLTGNRYAIFGQLTINELLFLGDEEDDVWQQDEVLEEMLKYLNLHIVQDGFTFYIYSWESVKGEERIYWRDLLTGASVTTARQTTDIRTGIVTDTDTTISVGEVYNKLLLTAKVESMESVIESPLDDDLLKSPYKNYQKYMTEYSSDGEGSTAIDAFDAMTHGQETTYSGGCVTDWYVQVKNNSEWLFPNMGSGNVMEELCSEGRNQQALPNLLAKQPGAAIIALGKVEKKTDGKDNSPTPKVEMTNYLVVSVNGNGDDKEATTYPNADSLKAGIPRAVYNGSMTGGVFSPTDEGTTNYIVLSGKLVLNPVMALTDTYKAIYNYDRPGYNGLPMLTGIRKWWHKTVPSRNNGDGRYYTQQWWQAEQPNQEVAWDVATEHGFVPFTDTGPQLYEFKYSAIGDGSDHISKVGVLACMLIIGDKCVVEKGTEGQVSDFEWRKYKTLEECQDEDEYYQQCFTIGFDPKIGDKIVGTKFDLQNNVSYELGIDAEGIAIPIKKGDKVSGRVRFMILGPVNAVWDVVTRRHKTWFRHTKWNSTTIPLLAHVSSIMVEQFEVKIYSDNGLVNNTGDNDLVYMSDTKESFVNVKDDLEMKINSALTAAECQALDVTDSVKMSTPVNTLTGEGLLEIYDHNREESAKPEQLYVDSYYREWHAPRVVMTQKLTDTDGGIVSLFAHYRHPMMGKTFFVQGISRNLEEGYAEMTLKEIEQ